MPDYAHLHLHTQYSLLDGATRIEDLLQKARRDEMKAVGISDHGNMFGVFKFAAEAHKQGVKPVIGCEFYLCNDRFDRKDRKRYHQILWAKDREGYENLSRLCSLGFLEGLYYKPRVDRKLVKQYAKGLIASTCCIQGEVPRTILDKGEAAGEKVFKEWLDIFGEDYYIELQRHNLSDQDKVNEVLVQWSKKYNVPMIATNDVHYLNQEDAKAHDILLCLQTGKDLSDPKRMKFSTDQFYFKTKDEMRELFKDIPEAMDNTVALTDKVEPLDLKRDILLPHYSLPKGFEDQDTYLRHLTFEGAKGRYGEVTQAIKERLDHELQIIKAMKFPGYFLIVEDFIRAARDLDVLVGPGRGSAAGSAVAYCLGITNVDPFRYNLLFERFLNPERVNMPDIDIDFDDYGRERVIDYVVKKYGENQVAQIVTFGTMAPRMAIRDVARVIGVSLGEADKLAKMIPEKPNMSFESAYKENQDLLQLRKKGPRHLQENLRFAEILEGSVRHSGIHAAGLIIAPDDLLKYVPVSKSKDSDLYITQFEGDHIEDAGMLKMDFLGLKTLTIIRDAIKNVQSRHNKEIEIDQIPLNDKTTFALYQRGDTIGTFQFESDGMRSYLKKLKPTHIEDLIAMNALYRPGPMDFIPDFINRKHGKQKVQYPHEMLEDILKPTYGIMVYQEQIMQTAQLMGGFTLGHADILRRAMGKKKMAVMQEKKKDFLQGAKEKKIDEKTAEKVFEMMEKFAQYGFNRSHSAAYSILAFQTAYLKANYPAEYMAAVLTNNMSDIKKIHFFLGECGRMGIQVLGPDINESYAKFRVNDEGAIRFGLAAIKGVGSAAMDEIVKERNNDGPFNSIFHLTQRVNLKKVNKKSLESLAVAGAFDNFGVNRASYFHRNAENESNVIEQAIRFGQSYQSRLQDSQNSLFGEGGLPEVAVPEIHEAEPWSSLELLSQEKEVTGIYLSGHPLDDYKLEVTYLCNCRISELENRKNQKIRMAGLVTEVQHRTGKTGKKFGLFTVEGYSGSTRIALFSDTYLKFKHFLEEGHLLFITGRMEYNDRFDRNELRVHDITLLSEVLEREKPEVILQVGLEDVSDGLVDKLSEVVEGNPGPCKLTFEVHHRDEKMRIRMPSRKKRIAFNKKVGEVLAAMPEVAFKVNGEG